MKENSLRDSKIKISELDLKIKIIKIKRVTTVVRGGRVLSYSALLAAGDSEKKIVGIGFGKGKDVAGAVNKAKNNATNNLIHIPLFKGTIPHNIRTKYKASYVFLKRSHQGKGIIAGGAMRIVLEVAGVTNILGKIRGSNNPHNVVMATIKALQNLDTPYMVAKRRGISLYKVFNG